jgi:hypothetical protein
VASAGKTEIFTHRLSGNDPTGIENTCHNGGIVIWNVTIKQPTAIPHRKACDSDVIFDPDAFASQRPLSGPSNVGEPSPSIVRVASRSRSLTLAPRVSV